MLITAAIAKRLFSNAATRVVITHSTYVDGLIETCKLLAKSSPCISTIVPGRITKVKGSTERLTFGVNVPIPGGFKVVAQKGASQEVFFTTTMTAEELQKHLNSITEPRKRR